MSFNMNTYWNQWDHEEIMSMYGIENDVTVYQEDTDILVHQEHACSSCMYCLGLSWKDFI